MDQLSPPASAQTPPQRGRRVLRWLRKVAALSVLTVLAIAAGTALRVHDPAFLVELRNLAFDEFQWLEPRTYDPDAPVRVLAIDEDSLARYGQWPWPRHRMAELTAKLSELGAAAIGYDVLFAEPDRMSPENIAEMLARTPGNSALVDQLRGAPQNDHLFAEALFASPSVVGTVLLSDTRTGPEGDAETARRAGAEPKAAFAFAGDDPRVFVPVFQSVSAPLPVLSESAAGVGALNWLPDRDQIVREIPLLFQTEDGAMMPSLAAEALRVAQGASTIVVRASNASGAEAYGQQTGIDAVRIGGLTIPTTATGAVRLHFTHKTAQRRISAWSVLEDEVDPNEVAGRVILVGATAPGLLDIRATPLDPAIPGVDVHAQLIEHVVSGVHLVRPDWAEGLEILVFAGLAVLFAVGAATLSPLWSIVLGLVTLSGVLVGSFYLFRDAGLLLDPSFPIVASGATLLLMTGWTAVNEATQRRWVRGAFSRYVAGDLVEDIAKNPDRLRLGGELRPMTILFTDMRNFTTISEGMDAQALTAFINDFLTPLTDVILQHRGTIDKYMGDAIMAFWNAPLDDDAHAAHACEAALVMLEALEKFNEDNAGRYPTTAIGIGLNTGICCVGNLGSNQRFDYSVVGDDVNIASRLEGQTKSYGVAILTGPQTTLEAREAGYHFVPVDTVKVKGKDIAIAISALIGGPNHPLSAEMAEAQQLVEALVEHVENDRLAAASTCLDALERLDQAQLRTLVALYRDRVNAAMGLEDALSP